MGLLDEVKDALDRLDIRENQSVATLINSLTDEEFGEGDEGDEDEG